MVTWTTWSWSCIAEVAESKLKLKLHAGIEVAWPNRSCKSEYFCPPKAVKDPTFVEWLDQLDFDWRVQGLWEFLYRAICHSHNLIAFPTWQLRLGSYMTRVLLVFLLRSGRTHREEDLTHPTFFPDFIISSPVTGHHYMALVSNLTDS